MGEGEKTQISSGDERVEISAGEKAEQVSDGVERLRVLPRQAPLTPLLLHLCTWATPFSEILRRAYMSELFPDCPVPQWSYILSSVLFGQDLL